jgi:hypothetical protein
MNIAANTFLPKLNVDVNVPEFKPVHIEVNVPEFRPMNFMP